MDGCCLDVCQLTIQMPSLQGWPYIYEFLSSIHTYVGTTSTHVHVLVALKLQLGSGFKFKLENSNVLCIFNVPGVKC